MIIIGPAIDWSEPGPRNSNRFPGECEGTRPISVTGVRRKDGQSVDTDFDRCPFSFERVAPP